MAGTEQGDTELDKGGVLDESVTDSNGDADKAQACGKADKDSQGEAFDFNVWAKNNGINRKTTAMLRKEDLATVEALVLLEPSDFKELDLTIGQRKLLQSAIGTLTAPERHKQSVKISDSGINRSDVNNIIVEKALSNPGTASGETENLTIADIRRQASLLETSGKKLDSSLSTCNNQRNHTQHVHVNCKYEQTDVLRGHIDEPCTRIVDPSDPRTILTVKATTKKVTHIVQFLSEQTKKRRLNKRKEWVLAKTGDMDSLVVKPDTEHPYSGISVAEWSAANCRLLAYLLRSGELSLDKVEYYLAYTTQIYDFASKYEWDSILDFDYNYRERQAEYGFAWGALTANMELQLLQPRVPRSLVPQSRTAPQKGRGQSGQGRAVDMPECKMFKARNGNCPFGEKCKYRHVLMENNAPSKND